MYFTFRPCNKFQKCENVSTEVPDAPLSFEAPLLPSQRFLGDIQASQLYQNSQRSHGQNQTGRLQETKHYSNYDLDLPVSQNYVPDILASQLYHNNQLEKDNSYHEKAGRGIANVRSGYKSDGLEKQSVNIILPKKTSRDMFKVQRMKDVDSTVEEKRTNFLHPGLYFNGLEDIYRLYCFKISFKKKKKMVRKHKEMPIYIKKIQSYCIIP